jgi:hypothetical protein
MFDIYFYMSIKDFVFLIQQIRLILTLTPRSRLMEFQARTTEVTEPAIIAVTVDIGLRDVLSIEEH